MPIRTNSAAAIVRFSGLGVLSFNEARTQAKNLFLHEAGHTLTVEIFKPLVARIKTFYSTRSEEATGLATFRTFPVDSELRDDDTGPLDEDREPRETLYKRVAVYDDIDVSQLDTLETELPLDVSIDISGEGARRMERIDRFHSDTIDFNREEGLGDKNDFRWIVDVTTDQLLGVPTGALTPTVPTSRLNIRNAMFYTHSRAANEDGELYVYQKVQQESGRTPGFTSLGTFGAINDEIGAKIDAEEGVKVVVKIGDEEHTHLLPKLDLPYVICIKNNAAVSGSDMPIYKKLFATTGPTFDLLTDAEISAIENSSMITGREFCSGIYEEFPPHD